jgi:hypothetical protein
MREEVLVLRICLRGDDLFLFLISFLVLCCLFVGDMFGNE